MFLPVIAAVVSAILNTFQAGANARLYKSLENPFYTALVVMASATSGILALMALSY
ncbi:MAG: EamA-like transporter family protein, partial [Proteobacteria bacterium]